MTFRFDAREALERIRGGASPDPKHPKVPTPPAESGKTVGALGTVEPAQAEIDALSDDLRDAWEERAGIMQFDGDLSRAEAERLALLDVLGRLH